MKSSIIWEAYRKCGRKKSVWRSSPAMASAIGASDAVKILLPAQRCSIRIAAGPPQSMQSCLNEAMRLLAEELELLCGNA